MIKRPLDVENATFNWTAFSDEPQTNSEEGTINENGKILHDRPLPCLSNDGDKSQGRVLVEHVASKNSESRDGSEIIDKKQSDAEHTSEYEHGSMDLREDTDKAQSKVRDISGMGVLRNKVFSGRGSGAYVF